MGYGIYRFVRFCVLGHAGMLGHTLARYLRLKGHDVATIPNRFSSASASTFVNAISATTPDWCINAIGVKLTKDTPLHVLTEANTDLPVVCANRLPTDIGFIHASSDAVFRPSLPERKSDEAPDATDLYGQSKARAEAQIAGPRQVVIRCSFVGPDRDSPRNLLSWLLNAREEVPGFTNHFWNGITSLQWAKTALEIAVSERETPIAQLGTCPPVSKYELLRMIASVWEADIQIAPVVADAAVLRTLIPTHLSPPLLEQLRELKEMQSALHRFDQ